MPLRDAANFQNKGYPMPTISGASLFTRDSFPGQRVPFHALTFDKAGICTSPESRDDAIAAIRADGTTDLVVYSHGWNNDWEAAQSLYTRTIDGFGAMAAAWPEKLPEGMKPAFLGIAWPSAAFLWPWEHGPDLAAQSDPEAPDDLAILTEGMDPERAQGLRNLVSGREEIHASELLRLAELLAPQFDGAAPEEGGAASGATADELVRMFRDASSIGKETQGGEDDFGSIGTPPAEGPDAAGVFTDVFGLRKVLRMATVLKMKDRAGLVGRYGMADTLSHLLAETHVRIHLVGHSYGAMLLMSAVAVRALPRRVTSVLLLQPAVNNLAFATDVGTGQPGGFRPAIDRVEKPILATRSNNDFPLRHIFHLVVRRGRDRGEVALAATPGKWNAMGGYGVHGVAPREVTRVVLPDPGQPYPKPGPHRIVELDGSNKIGSHSDVTRDHVYWAIIENLS